MFHKFSLKFQELDIGRLKGDLVEQYGNKETNVTLYHYSIKDWTYFYGIHKGKIKFNIMPSTVLWTEISGESDLTPHVDPLVTVALNYYIDPKGCTTSFWKTKQDTIYDTTRQQLDEENENQTVLVVKDYNQLEELGSFIAESESAYLIRTDMLHSVSNPAGSRTFLSYRWIGFDYNQILESIEIL